MCQNEIVGFGTGREGRSDWSSASEMPDMSPIAGKC